MWIKPYGGKNITTRVMTFWCSLLYKRIDTSKRITVMLRISVLAAIILRDALLGSDLKPNLGLRLNRNNGKLSLKLNGFHVNDRIMWIAGTPLIVVDGITENELGDVIIDIDDVNEDNDLVIRQYV